MLNKLLLLGAVLLPTALASSPFVCVVNAGTPLIARSEGITEPVGDVLLQCTGGTPTPAGQPIPTVTVQISLNTSVTNRLVSGVVTDAILFIDEPYPPLAQAVPNNVNVPPNSPVPILCAPGTTCSETGVGGASTAYTSANDPYINQPNVFLGTLASSSSIQWSNVPLDPPGDSGLRILRITNIRANASALGVSVTGIP